MPSTSVHLTNQETLAVLDIALQVLQKEVHPEVTAARLSALVAIMQNPGMPQQELQGRVHLEQQGISRAVTALQGKRTKTGDGYPRLIIATPKPDYSRANVLSATVDAGLLLNKITGQINKYLGSRAGA